jgi:hypothetical protein
VNVPYVAKNSQINYCRRKEKIKNIKEIRRKGKRRI